ncbi:hypothetical protein BDF22DRAFT_683640 [Syncephalis plumigaleata]|nr:hypothetical protein BDF22DRAFT_683640 [Syncephalis plumigaleata]
MNSSRHVRTLERWMNTCYIDAEAVWAVYCRIRKDPQAMSGLKEKHYSWLRNALHHQLGPIGPQSVVILCEDQRKYWRLRSAADEVAVGFEAEAAHLWSLYRLQAFSQVEKVFHRMQNAIEEAKAEQAFQKRMTRANSSSNNNNKATSKSKDKSNVMEDSIDSDAKNKASTSISIPDAPGPAAWACLILSLAQMGDGPGAQSALNGMLQAGYRERPGLPLHVHVIIGYLQSSKPHRAASLYERLSKMPLDDPLLVNGPELNSEQQSKMWNRLAGTLAKFNLTKQATELTQRMRRDGIPLNLITQTTLVNSVARNRRVTSDVLNRLYSAMLASYPKMSMVAHTSFVEQFACRGDVVGAQRVLQRMIADGYKPDCFCYTSLMKAYARQNNLAAVWHVYRDMLINKVELNVVTYTAMIRWFTTTGDQESLSVCLREMRLRGVRPNTVTCNTLIWASARVGDYQRAAIVYRDMLRQGLHPDAFTYTWLFNASHPRALLGIDDEDLMSTSDETADAIGRSAATSASTSSGSFNNNNHTNWYQRGLYVLGWFRDMQQLGVRPARQTIYAVAMSTLLRAGMYRGVLEVGDAVIQHGMTPSDYVFDMCRQARLRIDEYEASLKADDHEDVEENIDSSTDADTDASNLVDTPKTLLPSSESVVATPSTSSTSSIARHHGRTPLEQGRFSRRRKPISLFTPISNAGTSSTSSPFTSSIIAQLNNVNATLNNPSNLDTQQHQHSSTTSPFLSQAGSVFTARASTLARPEARLDAPTLLSKTAINRLPLNERIRIRRYCTISP